MYIFTIISNTTCLYLNIQNIKGIHLLAELITGNHNSISFSCVQTVSSEFKERLKLLDTLGDSSYKVKKFFSDIPINQHFLILSGRIDDELQKNLLKRELFRIDGLPYNDIIIDKIISNLYSHYEVRVFQGNQRLRIGVKDKSQRICRFCGKTMPKAKFKKKAHAISESLGNKGLVCLEECDECNTRFGQTIEQDIEKLLQFQLMLKGIKGKVGSPSVKWKGVSVKNDSSSSVNNDTKTIVLNFENKIAPQNKLELERFLSQNVSFIKEKIVPQNIYKCFCKYVLSLIDAHYLPYFKDTIKWINEEPTERVLPPVEFCQIPIGETPCMAIMIRKHNHTEIPYCWAIINVAEYQFLFIIPFCSKDKCDFIDKHSIIEFMNIIKNVMPNLNMEPLCFDGITPINIENTLHFYIPADFVEGRDYYFVSTK